MVGRVSGVQGIAEPANTSLPLRIMSKIGAIGIASPRAKHIGVG